jgi:hypothetical protein
MLSIDDILFAGLTSSHTLSPEEIVALAISAYTPTFMGY